MLLNDLKKAALCVAAGFAVTMFGGCDSQKSTGAPAGAGAQRAPHVSVTEIQPTELDMTTTLRRTLRIWSLMFVHGRRYSAETAL